MALKLAPIVLFVYNRPYHTQKTVEALKKNKLSEESELIIYSDAAKNEEAIGFVNEVRLYIKAIIGFKKITIIEREKNWGLADSILDGVSSNINKYGKIIVLEDDLVTSCNFLKFMNEGLDSFEAREDIFSVTGFNFPEAQLKIPNTYKDEVYLSYRCMSWGWATWKDRWNKVDWDMKDFDSFSSNTDKIKLFNRGGEDLFPMLRSQLNGKIDSWAIRFCFGHFVNNAYCVYPVKSLINNEGFDGSGVHCGVDKSNKFKNDLFEDKDLEINKNILLNKEIIDKFYLINKKSFFRRVKNLIRRYI
jgi:hypothetical protein